MFPDGKLGPDPRWYDHGYRPQQLGNAQALYIYQRERARTRAKLPPAEPVIRERRCRICQRRITWGYKRYCEACRANLNNGFNRRLVSERRRAGQCVRCGAAAVKGQTNCVSCRAIARKRYTPGTRAATKRRLLDHRKARRVCTICEAPAAAGRTRCAPCLSDSRSRHRRDRAHWRATGRCVGCGRAPERANICNICLARGKTLRAANQAAGFCRCGGFRASGRMSCSACLTKAREYQRRRAAAKVSEKAG